jgi:cyclopropane-fatty-acyl-phospholipid synthase
MSKAILTKGLARLIKKGRLQIKFADGTIGEFGKPAAGFPEVVWRYTDNRVPWDIVKDPDLGMAESYMDGRAVLEQGTIMQMLELLRANNPYEESGGKRKLSHLGRVISQIKFRLDQYNTGKQSKKNVAHHYDIGNDLYELMLDPEHMQYSCGYWPRSDMTLEEAQQEKLAHIASKLALAAGQSVLDIGCGWGGMAVYLAKHFNVEVTAITLSEEQLNLARTRASSAGVLDRVTFKLADYRDLAAEGRRFDRIVSVGMFEHVGRPQFDTFFECCADLLASDGVMLIHTIGRMGPPGLTDRFTSKYIFPGGYIPALSETMAASEKSGLILSDVEVLRLHYAKTLRSWCDNCLAKKEAIVAMYDERFFRMWTCYLAGAATVFEYGGMVNFQIQYTADRRALPITRDYMAKCEERLNPKLVQA